MARPEPVLRDPPLLRMEHGQNDRLRHAGRRQSGAESCTGKEVSELLHCAVGERCRRNMTCHICAYARSGRTELDKPTWRAHLVRYPAVRPTSRLALQAASSSAGGPPWFCNLPYRSSGNLFGASRSVLVSRAMTPPELFLTR